MISVRIAELKNRLSEYLRAVRRGETLTVTDRDTPIARIVPWVAEDASLVVRAAKAELREARKRRLPRRPGARTNSLAALLEERGQR